MIPKISSIPSSSFSFEEASAQLNLKCNSLIDLHAGNTFVTDTADAQEDIISVPSYYIARPYQHNLYNAIANGYKRAFVVWHRRSGKDRTMLALIAKEAYKKTGIYYYIFPTYSQGRKALWDAIGKDGRKFLHMIPDEIIKSKNNQEMKIVLENDSIIQVIGSDKIDSIVGTNPCMAVLSEYSLQNPSAWLYLRPIFAENGGIAIFNTTPRGKNHAYKMFTMAEKSADWFTELLPYWKTGAITQEIVDKEVEEGMPQAEADQEYGCSWEAASVGSYYGDLMNSHNLLGEYPYIKELPLFTFWDIGVDDATSIWFVQPNLKTGELRIVDFYENNGEGLPFYTTVINDKVAEYGYRYSNHYMPHDASHRNFQTGETVVMAGKRLGIKFSVVPRVGIVDGVDAVRSILPTCRFNKKTTEKGYNCLLQYHRKYNEKTDSFSNTPVHDWSSHASDAFRYAGLSYEIIFKEHWRPGDSMKSNNGMSSLQTLGYSYGSSSWNG